MEGHRVDQEAKVTDNFGNHDNRGKQPSVRKVECGLQCNAAIREVVRGYHASEVTEVTEVISNRRLDGLYGSRISDQNAGPHAAAAGAFALGDDLVVNRLGPGAMRLTGKGIRVEPEDPEEARRMLRRAVELRVNLMGTAASYGPEVSERLIVEALHLYSDDPVMVASPHSGPADHKRDCRSR